MRIGELGNVACFNRIGGASDNYTVFMRYLCDLYAIFTQTPREEMPGSWYIAIEIGRTVPVGATMPNMDELLWPGTLVTVQLTSREEEAVAVPTTAMQVSQSGSFVLW